MANLLVEEPDALMRARPGLWEPWWVTARATRPSAANHLCQLNEEGATEADFVQPKMSEVNYTFVCKQNSDVPHR
jgi:hypothetical protein